MLLDSTQSLEIYKYENKDINAALETVGSLLGDDLCAVFLAKVDS